MKGPRLQAALAQAPVLALAIVGVTLFAALVRWLGYTGFFGSDEVTYIEHAFKVLDGDWSLSEYAGANRIGVNLPMAAFGALLGRDEFGAAAYSLLCSVAEVGLVTWVGARVFGMRAGVAAGLLMAALPGHVHVGGRILADAPLALAVSASFILFFEGELRRWSAGYFFAGVMAGLAFLVKPSAVFVFAILLLYPLVARRWDSRWLWMGAGFVLAMAVNGLLFQALTGHFWYVFENISTRLHSGYLESGIAAGKISTAPYFYPAYLLAKIYHTGLVGPLALAGGLLLIWRRSKREASTSLAARYLLFWALGLLIILSFLPVAFNPFALVPKQTNYMLLFAAPLCLLAGVALARLPVGLSNFGVALAVAVGIIFALLLQASVAVFTSNSFATLAFARERPKATVYAMSNAYRAAWFNRLVGAEDLTDRVRPVDKRDQDSKDSERFAVVDEETFTWDDSAPFKKPTEVPACWVMVQTLRGEPGGAGVALIRFVAPVVQSVPGLRGSAIDRRLAGLLHPRPAHVYRLAPGC